MEEKGRGTRIHGKPEQEGGDLGLPALRLFPALAGTTARRKAQSARRKRLRAPLALAFPFALAAVPGWGGRPLRLRFRLRLRPFRLPRLEEMDRDSAEVMPLVRRGPVAPGRAQAAAAV